MTRCLVHQTGLPQYSLPFQASYGQPKQILSRRGQTNRSARGLRCRAGGRSEQNSWSFLSWGADMIKRLGTPVVKQAEEQLQPAEEPAPAEIAPEESRADSRSLHSDHSEEEMEASTSGRQAWHDRATELLQRKELVMEERRRDYRHLSRQQEITEEWPPQGTPTWYDWMQAFKHTDECEQECAEMEQAITEAVEQEDFKTAAQLKEKMNELLKLDEVDGMIEAYREALQTEDFKEAARLRDEGSVSLLGWWWPQSTNAKNPSHLLRVVQAFNRYMFLAYNPSDIASLHGYFLTKDGILADSETQFNPVPSREEYDRLGMPVAELHLKSLRTEEGVSQKDSPLESQACAFTNTDNPDSDDESDRESEATIVALEELAEESSGEPSEGITVHHLEEPKEGPQVIRVTISPQGNSLDAPGNLMDSFTRVAGQQLGSDEAPDYAPSFVEQNIQRVPAIITKYENDRNRFMLSVMPSEYEEFLAQEAAKQETAKQLSAQQQAVLRRIPPHTAMIVAHKPGDYDERSQPKMKVTKLPTKEPGSWSVEYQSTAAEEQDEQAEDSDGPKEAQDVDLKEALAVQVNLKPGVDASKVDYKQLADQILEGRGLSQESGLVAEILKNAIGEIGNSVSSNQDPTYGLTGSLSYKRIPLNQPRTDPFTGIFVGSFGGHGPEIVQLQRAMGEDGKEYVEGTKLTGDENVPAGNVAFRAPIGPKQRLSRGFYPPELNVTARYKGQGRVAKPGYKDARWVDGELLQFGGSMEFAKGAELGFLWNLNSESRFMSVFQRVTLDDPLAPGM